MSERRSRVGLQDAARTAGVSVATVDRVLNERGNVSPATVRRVRIEVLLARPDTPFLARGFSPVAATLDRAVVLQRTTLANAEPAKVAARIGGREPTRSSSTVRTTPRSRPPSTRSPRPAAPSSAS